MPRTGRPRIIKITPEVFEGMCRVQCTETEIAEILSCSIDTLKRWIRKTYKLSFAQVYKNHSGIGKMSLRRAQMKAAEAGNATMLIWMGKQVLNQRDEKYIRFDPSDLTDEQLQRIASGESIELVLAGAKSDLASEAVH